MKFKSLYLFLLASKVFYLIFAFLVYGRITSLGDTIDYLASSIKLSPQVLYNSSALMDFTGGIFKKIFLLDILASIPFCILAFYGIYYAIDRLKLYRYPLLTSLLLVMPSFGVWTSIHSKEAVACFFCGILAPLIINFTRSKYEVKIIDLVAIYLCLIFKPQYFLFISQALIYLRLIGWFNLKAYPAFILGTFIIICNVVTIYILRDLIDELAQGMLIHFVSNSPDAAKSSRSADPWFVQYGFFKEMPYGMFIAFWGPTITEMLQKPAQLISGLESAIITILFGFIFINGTVRFFVQNIFSPKVFFCYLIILFGILFVHYPFGYLNPGSAIRYRENFYLLFIVLLLYLIIKDRNEKRTPVNNNDIT